MPFDIKLELVSKIFENIKTNINKPEVNKDELLDELYGSWEDVDDSVVEDILTLRTTSEKAINLD